MWNFSKLLLARERAWAEEKKEECGFSVEPTFQYSSSLCNTAVSGEWLDIVEAERSRERKHFPIDVGASNENSIF